MSILALAMAAALAFQQAPPESAAPPAPAPPADDSTIEGLVVTASPKTETEVIQAFVADITGETSDGKVARWDLKVCPGVTGVKPAYAQFINDRISKVAGELGLGIGEPGCHVNILIVFTSDSDNFVKKALAQDASVFSKYDLTMTAGRKALKAFETSTAPVRWWHVTHRVTADGIQYVPGQSVRVRGATRTKSNARSDFDRAIVVVDASRVRSVRFAAFADYLAFVSLAQIDPEADAGGVPTILSLFADRDAGREPAAGMTDWDNAYLAGVYGARRDARTGDAQKADVVRSMSGALNDPAKEEPAPAPKP
jgi:hypothetical protein